MGEFAWTPPGPDSPPFDGLNPDHVYDLIQARNCERARYKYDLVGADRRQSQPVKWQLLNGLIGACFALTGQEDQWQTAIDSYNSIKGQPSGDCKYAAGFRSLKQLAEFRIKYPRGEVRIHKTPAGVAACPTRVDSVSTRTAKPGDVVSVRGTWPSEITVYLGTREVALTEESSDKACCQNAFAAFEIPADMTPGTVQITLKTATVDLDAGPLDITAS
ncbi:hypothetical protein [Streptomyces avermitilis]|uniref:hypothetical protein n=1 Tax=Streptomyces avermitilis TaxID=33903 RepID=UPI0033A19334